MDNVLKNISIDDNEEWKVVTEYPNYYVSSYGRVYSVKTKKILKQTGNRYLVVTLRNNVVPKITKAVHRLIAEAFLIKINETYVVDHIDRNKTNNNISNLRYVTISENNRNKDVRGSIRKTTWNTFNVRYPLITGTIINKTFKDYNIACQYLDQLCITHKR